MPKIATRAGSSSIEQTLSAARGRLHIANEDLQVIVFCSEGYTSSLASSSLQDLGLWRATDMVGGFAAWREAGLGATLAADANTGAE